MLLAHKKTSWFDWGREIRKALIMSDEELSDKRVAILQWAIGVMAVILMSAVPFAFYVSNDIASIKTSLHTMKAVEVPPPWFRDKVEDNEESIEKLETKMILIERKVYNGHDIK